MNRQNRQKTNKGNIQAQTGKLENQNPEMLFMKYNQDYTLFIAYQEHKSAPFSLKK